MSETGICSKNISLTIQEYDSPPYHTEIPEVISIDGKYHGFKQFIWGYAGVVLAYADVQYGMFYTEDKAELRGVVTDFKLLYQNDFMDPDQTVRYDTVYLRDIPHPTDKYAKYLMLDYLFDQLFDKKHSIGYVRLSADDLESRDHQFLFRKLCSLRWMSRNDVYHVEYIENLPMQVKSKVSTAHSLSELYQEELKHDARRHTPYVGLQLAGDANRYSFYVYWDPYVFGGSRNILRLLDEDVSFEEPPLLTPLHISIAGQFGGSTSSDIYLRLMTRTETKVTLHSSMAYHATYFTHVNSNYL